MQDRPTELIYTQQAIDQGLNREKLQPQIEKMEADVSKYVDQMIEKLNAKKADSITIKGEVIELNVIVENARQLVTELTGITPPQPEVYLVDGELKPEHRGAVRYPGIIVLNSDQIVEQSKTMSRKFIEGRLTVDLVHELIHLINMSFTIVIEAESQLTTASATTKSLAVEDEKGRSTGKLLEEIPSSYFAQKALLLLKERLPLTRQEAEIILYMNEFDWLASRIFTAIYRALIHYQKSVPAKKIVENVGSEDEFIRLFIEAKADPKKFILLKNIIEQLTVHMTSKIAGAFPDQEKELTSQWKKHNITIFDELMTFKYGDVLPRQLEIDVHTLLNKVHAIESFWQEKMEVQRIKKMDEAKKRKSQGA